MPLPSAYIDESLSNVVCTRSEGRGTHSTKGDSVAPYKVCSLRVNSKVYSELPRITLPGADLSEPWESHAVAALSWWLLCRGVKAPTGCRGNKLLFVDPVLLSPWVT